MHSHTDGFTDTEQLLGTEALHRETFAQSSFFTQTLCTHTGAFSHGSLYAAFYTVEHVNRKFLDRAALLYT